MDFRARIKLSIAITILLSCLLLPTLAKSEDYILNKVSLQRQSAIVGGACTDCIVNKKTPAPCGDNRTCVNADDCESGTHYGCDDGTKDENCKFNSWSLFECVTDPAHTCNPIRVENGNCVSGGGTKVCQYATGDDYGNCTGPATVRQCHY